MGFTEILTNKWGMSLGAQIDVRSGGGNSAAVCFRPDRNEPIHLIAAVDRTGELLEKRKRPKLIILRDDPNGVTVSHGKTVRFLRPEESIKLTLANGTKLSIMGTIGLGISIGPAKK